MYVDPTSAASHSLLPGGFGNSAMGLVSGVLEEGAILHHPPRTK